jgi:protein-S-isoprenylcysteine O-methyltransferase Ste14
MAVSDTLGAKANQSTAGATYARLYRIVAYFGLMSVFAALIYGFRFDAQAPWQNCVFDLGLYAAFIAPHLVLTRGWWKKAVWGQAAGNPRERRFYIAVTLITWLAVLGIHRPMPGPIVELPEPVRFAGVIAFLWSLLLFFEGTTRAALDGLLGVPGTVLQYSHGSETPLYTDGSYAEVRHPMYRAAILAGLSTLLVHPHAAQVVWSGLIGLTFIAFIPVEEAQLLTSRGDDYRRYCQQTPYRLFRGVW